MNDNLTLKNEKFWKKNHSLWNGLNKVSGSGNEIVHRGIGKIMPKSSSNTLNINLLLLILLKIRCDESN